MDQLMAIRGFVRVVEAGSFTRAADSLDMPNATLSKQVQELEAHLGVRLLQRTTRRVTVTPEGRDYYEKTTRILRDLEDIDTSFDVARSKPRGHLRVDVGGSTARDVLVPALPGFTARYPDIRIDLGVSDRSADLISDNIDCVIRGGALDSSSLVARHIGDASLLTCAAPAYLKQFGTPAYPQELKNGHRLVSYLSPQNGRAFPFRFARGAEKLEIKVEHRVGVNESNAHLAAAVAGLGIVQTFGYAARAALENGALVEILRPWRPPAYPFHVVYPQNRHVSQRLRVFIDWLLESLPSRIAAEPERPASPARKRRS
ncbi:LysR family transcriptional regulator [Herbaspirillum huttiense]|uniref:LysR family transcriptional regulator n=1 Tax=Herbaspirillum huttiense TaxID=863372 RepID=UPI0039AF050D